MNKEYKIKYLCQNTILNATIVLYFVDNGETLLKYIDEDEIWEEKGPHLFVTFCDLRKYLNLKEKILLCKGCRINVHPSGSQLKWIFAYNLTKGIRVDPDKDEVMIFDEELEMDKIVSVEKQEQFYREWIDSIRGLPYTKEQSVR